MSHQLSQQHPAVVLRSHYVHIRALLAIAMIAVVGLTITVVLLAVAVGQSCARQSHGAVGFDATSGSRHRTSRQAIAGLIQWACSFSRLWVAAWNRHSERAAALPRRWKRRNPRLNLFCANTGSTVALRCL